MTFSRSQLARQKAGVASLATIAALALTPAAQAQAENSPAADDGSVIIVTARFEEENIQDVPLPITAFDAEAIERRNITELDDVARFTAGFAFEDFDGGNANPAIRGQATLRNNAREQTVAAFVDGVYLPRSWVVDLGTENFERIEIVKGPQSSRYGRNAFAGAINYVSKRPTSDLSASGQVTLGNYDRFDIGGSVSIPIADDRLGVQLSYSHSEFDGSWKNAHPNADISLPIGSTGRIGGWDNQSWSAMVKAEPTDNIDIEVAYYSFDKSEEARAAQWLNTGQGDGNCGALQVGDNPSLFCGTFGVRADTVTMDPRGFGRQADIDIFRGSLTIEPTDSLTVFYQFGQIWGSTLTANTAESNTTSCGTILGAFFPGGPFCNFQAAPVGDIDYNQHELRLTYDDGGMFRGAIGGFYMDGIDEAFSISVNVPPLGTAPLMLDPRNSSAFPDLSNFVFNAAETTTEVKSVFGEFTLSFNDDQTRISAEGRYTSEKITTFNVQGAPALVGDQTFDFFTPRITVEHDLSPDNLLYATVARGAKAGGFNAGAITPSLAEYDPEFNWTYEIGLKNTLFNGDMTLNLAAFYTDWSALQITVSDPLGTPFTAVMTDNLGDARIYGVEAEGAWQATDQISFDFAASYTNARYKDGTTDAQFIRGTPPNFPAPCDGTVCAVDGEIGGNPLERSPEWQLALGAQLEDDLSDDWSFFIRGDVAYQSEHSAYAIATAFAPGRTVSHARAAVTYDDTLTIAIWARNLFDEKYVSNSLGIIQPFSNNILGTYYGERRTIGATVSLSY